MNSTKRITVTFIVCFVLIFMIGCTSLNGSRTVEATTLPPTAPATLPELVDTLSSDSAEARISAAFALSRFGKNAKVAIPNLILNLHYETNSDVREAAAIALGQLGPDAQEAVSALIDTLRNDKSVTVRSHTAEALGQIGNPKSVPVLISILYEKDIKGRTNLKLKINAAKSISLITGENFPDTGSGHGFRLNSEGVPLIVVAARQWWEEEGQYRKWEVEDQTLEGQ